MFPTGHAALGYLLYSGWRRYGVGAGPTGKPVLALVLGTQVPDLIDKPLSWTFSILPSGRSFGHSLLILALVGVVLTVFARWQLNRQRQTMVANGAGVDRVWERVSEPAVGAFLLGWGSHMLGDSWTVLVGWDDCASYLLWPVLSICKYPEENRTILGHVLSIEMSFNLGLSLVLTGLAALVWVLDGKPGLNLVRRWLVKTIGR